MIFISVPKYYEFIPFIIKFLSDNQTKTIKEITEYCATEFDLSESDRNEKLPSGKTKIYDRVGWAKTYLKKAGLIESPKRGTVCLTKAGHEAFKNSNSNVTLEYLSNFDAFTQFRNRSNNKKREEQLFEYSQIKNESPQEQIELALQELNDELISELMVEVSKISPYEFEKLVVRLLIKMGYGDMEENKDAVTKKSDDEGIDGIVSADKFGFDSIYIQAKQWKSDNSIGRPEIQRFLGALAGQGASKGIFITTSQFSKGAVEFASKQLHSKIVLVDGRQLAKLMIEYNLGVSTIATYEVKRIDSDFFDECIN